MSAFGARKLSVTEKMTKSSALKVRPPQLKLDSPRTMMKKQGSITGYVMLSPSSKNKGGMPQSALENLQMYPNRTPERPLTVKKGRKIAKGNMH